MAKSDLESQQVADPPLSETETIPFWRKIVDQGAITKNVLEHKFLGSGSQQDPFIVTWIPEDPSNPKLYGMGRKIGITIAVSTATLAVGLGSSAYSGGIEQVEQHFNIGSEVATLGLSLYVIGFALGPMVWAPLSEFTGRQYPFWASFGGMAALFAGCAGAQNIWTLIILRFFAGAFGSAPLTNAGGVISDMFEARHRGLALSLFAAAPFMGPVIGPMTGGFVGMNVGWRWIEGVLAIFAGVMWFVIILLVPETYAPILLRQRAARLTQMTGRVYRTQLDVDSEQQNISVKRMLGTTLLRPWILLVREPIVLIMSLYIAIIYGALFMMFAAFPIVYEEDRGWNEGVGGLAFLGIMVGMICGVIYTIPDNKRYLKTMERNGGHAPPEARLPPVIVASIAIPIALFWFAWTNSPSIHWMVSIAAGAPFGFGIILIYLGTISYLIDSYTIFSASVLAASSVLRSGFGGIFPLFTTYMYNNLGIHWASSIPAFLTVACMPFPFIFYRFGKSIRSRCKYAALSQEYMDKLLDTKEMDDEISKSD